MKITPALEAQLNELEKSLWEEKTRFDETYMESILHPDFFEFGRSGRIYRREDTIGVAPQNIEALFPLENFKVHSVDLNTVLVTYMSQVGADGDWERGNRSSLWVKMGGQWKLRFHQGTPVL